MEENKKNLSGLNEQYQTDIDSSDGKIVVPVIEEHVVISKELVETGKVLIKKRVKEEEAFINIPIIQEGYIVERKPGKKELLTHHPAVRHEGDKMIIPVVREVLVVEKRYEVTEEVHVIKTKTEVPNMQQITLLKEEVQVERTKSNVK